MPYKTVNLINVYVFLKRIFLMWIIFRVFIECITLSLLSYVLFFRLLDQGANLQSLHWKAKS